MKVGINAARELFYPYPLDQKLRMLGHFMEIFKVSKKAGEEWFIELGVSAFPGIYKPKKGKVDINRTLALISMPASI